MTDRAYLTLNTDKDRDTACKWARGLPAGTRVTFVKGDKRSDEQNRLLWPLLTAVARQKDWHGVKLDEGDWKDLFMEALNREMRLVPNLDGNGFVALGRSSSKLTVGEFTQLIELIYAWGAQNGVNFEQRSEAA